MSIFETKPAGSAFLTADELTRTITGAGTISPATYFNTSAVTFLKQNTEYGRDRIPDGTAVGDFWNVRVDKSSKVYRIEQTTARTTDGGRNLVACLAPGAEGFFRWDGIEWWYEGSGAIWWPIAGNKMAAWQNPPDGVINTHSLAVYDGGVVVAGQDTSATVEAQWWVVPYGTNLQADTIGSAVTQAGGAAATDSSVFALNQTVFIGAYYDGTNTRLITLTRSGTTLTKASTPTTLVGSNASDDILRLIGLTASTFIIVLKTTIDSAAAPEFLYCTIAGTGASAVITVNTGISAGATVGALTNAHNCVTNDPNNPENVFTILAEDDGGTNTTATAISRVAYDGGTSFTVERQWQQTHTVYNVNDDYIIKDVKDGRLVVTNEANNQTQWLTGLDDAEIEICGSVRSSFLHSGLIGANGNSEGLIAFGGVVAGIGDERGGEAVRVSRAVVSGGAGAGMPEGSENAPPNIYSPTMEGMDFGTLAGWLLPEIAGANVTLTETVMYTNDNGAYDNEGTGMILMLAHDSGDDSVVNLMVYETASASRYL